MPSERDYQDVLSDSASLVDDIPSPSIFDNKLQREIEDAVDSELPDSVLKKIYEVEEAEDLLPRKMASKTQTVPLNFRSIFSVIDIVVADYVRKQKEWFQFIPGVLEDNKTSPARFKAYLVWITFQCFREYGLFDFADFDLTIIDLNDDIKVPMVLAVMIQHCRPYHTSKAKYQPVFDKRTFEIVNECICGPGYVQADLSSPADLYYQGSVGQANGIYREEYMDVGLLGNVYGDYVVKKVDPIVNGPIPLQEFVDTITTPGIDNQIQMNELNQLVATLPSVSFSKLKLRTVSTKNPEIASIRGEATNGNTIRCNLPIEKTRNLASLFFWYNNQQREGSNGTNTQFRSQGTTNPGIYGTKVILNVAFARFETYQYMLNNAENIVNKINSGAEIEDADFIMFQRQGKKGRKEINPIAVHVPVNQSILSQVANKYASYLYSQYKRAGDVLPEDFIDQTRLVRNLQLELNSFVISNIKQSTPSGLLSPNQGSGGVGYGMIPIPSLFKYYNRIISQVIDQGQDSKLSTYIFPFWVKEQSYSWGNTVNSTVISDEPYRMNGCTTAQEPFFNQQRRNEECAVDDKKSIQEGTRKLVKRTTPDEKKKILVANHNFSPDRLFLYDDLSNPAVVENDSNLSEKKQMIRRKMMDMRNTKASRAQEIRKTKKHVKSCCATLANPANYQVAQPPPDSFENIVLDDLWVDEYEAIQADTDIDANVIPVALANIFQYIVQVESALSMATLNTYQGKQLFLGGPQLRTQVSAEVLTTFEVPKTESSDEALYALQANATQMTSPREITGGDLNLCVNSPFQIDYLAFDADTQDFVSTQPFNYRIPTTFADTTAMEGVISYMVQQNGQYQKDVAKLSQLHKTGHFKSGLGSVMYEGGDCSLGVLVEKFAIGIGRATGAVVGLVTGSSGGAKRGETVAKEVINLYKDGKGLATGLMEAANVKGKAEKYERLKQEVDKVTANHARKVMGKKSEPKRKNKTQPKNKPKGKGKGKK